MQCPECLETHPLKLWETTVSWGCSTCGFYEDAYKGPSNSPTQLRQRALFTTVVSRVSNDEDNLRIRTG